MPEEYLSVPASEAEDIAETFRKEIVIIVCYDQAHNKIHCTTFGVQPKSKEAAATLGHQMMEHLFGLAGTPAQIFADFRTTPEAEYKKQIDDLRHTIRHLEAQLEK